MTKEEQIEYVKKYWANIGDIKKPDEDVKLAAVRQDIRAIQFIDYPDKDVQIEVIKENLNAFYCIKNPDKDVIRMFKLKEKLNKL